MFIHLLTKRWVSWIGIRYLFSKKNSRFLNFITFLSLIGVMLGVSAMIIVLCVMDGFETKLKSRMMQTVSHILIEPLPTFPGYENGFVPKESLLKSPFDARFNDSRIESVSPVVFAEVILKANQRAVGAQVKGLSETEFKLKESMLVESIDPTLVQEKHLTEGVLLGKQLAYELEVLPGDTLTIISPIHMQGPLGNIPLFKKVTVIGLFKSPSLDQELHTVFATHATLWSFLGKKDVYSNLEVKVFNFDQASVVAKNLILKYPDCRISDWKQLNAHLFFSLRLERICMFIILTFIVIVASFNIVTTLMMMVLEKQKDVSILRAIGVSSDQIGGIFLAEGLFIGFVGGILGILLGFGTCVFLSRYDIIKLPAVFYDRTLPVTFAIHYYVIAFFSSFSVALVACLYPALRASRQNLLKGFI